MDHQSQAPTGPHSAGNTSRRRPMFLLNDQYLPTSRDWRQSPSQDSPFDISTFIRQAQQAEAADIDAVFQADFSGVSRGALKSGPPLQAFDSFQKAALVAAATEKIALMPTVSTMHTHPFSFARSLASLDRISAGRAWINIVSSFRSGTGLGSTRTIPRERRHDQTDEFVDVSKRLWASWPTEANQTSPSTGQYIHADLITDLNHHGEFYDQPGPIDMPPYSARFPFTLEATSSLEGVQLAARSADAIFAGTPTLGAAQAFRAIMVQECERAGRSPEELRLLPGCFINIVDSENERDRILELEHQRNLKIASNPHAIVHFHSQYPGLNLKELHASDPLPADVLPEDPSEVFAEHGSRYLPLWDLARRENETVGEFAAAVFSLGEHARFLGTPEQIAEELTCWYEEDGVDGFQFILGTDFDALCERIVPAVRAAT